MNILDPFRRFLFTHLDFTLFPWTNSMQLSEQSLVRCRRFHGYHCPDGNTHVKNGRSFKKYSKFTPAIYINPNSYSFRIMFIMIIVRFFITCFNRWNMKKWLQTETWSQIDAFHLRITHNKKGGTWKIWI